MSITKKGESKSRLSLVEMLAMRSAGATLAEIATATGLSISYVSLVFKGRRRIKGLQVDKPVYKSPRAITCPTLDTEAVVYGDCVNRIGALVPDSAHRVARMLLERFAKQS